AARLRPMNVSPSAPLSAAGLEGGKGLKSPAHAEGATREEKVKTDRKKAQTEGGERLKTIPSHTLYPLPSTLDPKAALEARTSDHDRVLRLTAENLNRLLGLAG